MRLAEIYNESNSKEHFFKKLETAGLNVYSRNNTIAGLQGNKRRYRLKTLGFSKERLQELHQNRLKELSKSRLKQLKKISKSKDQDMGLKR